MYERVELDGVILDPITQRPILVLRSSKDSNRFIPIWIGSPEANAIILKVEGVEVPRPMTHDLLAKILTVSGTRVEAVRITELKENTFFAVIDLRSGDDVHEVDARPSDAIAIALRTETPILVHGAVFDQASSPQGDKDTPEELRGWLDVFDAEDAEYEM